MPLPASRRDDSPWAPDRTGRPLEDDDRSTGFDMSTDSALTARYEHFPHDADIGVRGFGRSQAEAFEQAALAMTAAVTDPRHIAPEHEVVVQCEAPDVELLLADWLNAIVYEMATRNMVFGRFDVRIGGGRLRGKAWGEELSAAKHEPAVEIKGATYTSLRVAREPDGAWLAQCVIDV